MRRSETNEGLETPKKKHMDEVCEDNKETRMDSNDMAYNHNAIYLNLMCCNFINGSIF